MPDFTNYWGIIFLLGLIFLFSSLVYPLLSRLIRSLITAHKIDYETKRVKSFLKPNTPLIIILAGFVSAGFGSWRLFNVSESNPRPPDFVAVQQEFKRYEKDRKNYVLDDTWKTFQLKQDLGWLDSGFDFSPGDYFWVISYDSCLIKLQPFGRDTTLFATVALACYQSSVTQQTAVSLKVSIKEPPLYYNESTNVFVKHWSKPEAQSAQYKDLLLGSSLFFLAALFIPLGFQLVVENKRGVKREYDDWLGQKEEEEELSKEEQERRRSCKSLIERHRLKVTKVGIDIFKEYLDARHLRDHYGTFLQRGDVVGYLEQLIDEGISADDLEDVIQEILEGAPHEKKERGPKKTPEEKVAEDMKQQQRKHDIQVKTIENDITNKMREKSALEKERDEKLPKISDPKERADTEAYFEMKIDILNEQIENLRMKLKKYL